jgi:hypothetical protein
MKIWVETRTVEPPEFTVSGRFGGSVMFVAYQRILDQWLWLQPGGIVEQIAEPPMIFVEQDYVNKHTLATPRAKREKAHHIRRKRSSQLQLDL